MNHILDVLPMAESWIVFGKGPSFNRNAEVKGSLKMCINETSNLVKADVAIMNDLPVIGRLNDFSIQNTALFAMPASIKRKEHQEADNTNFWVEHSCLLSRICDRISYFDTNFTMATVFENKPMLHAHVSTFETCIWLLAYAGVKKVYTSGIDHSVAYSPDFGERSSAVPYSAVPYYVKVATDHFGIEVIPL
jgi:hypothetical protein